MGSLAPEQQRSLSVSPYVFGCDTGTSRQVFSFSFFPVGLDLWLGSSSPDSQPGVTRVKCCSWNIKIDLISWLILLNERAWSWTTAQSPVAPWAELPPRSTWPRYLRDSGDFPGGQEFGFPGSKQVWFIEVPHHGKAGGIGCDCVQVCLGKMLHVCEGSAFS